MLKHIPRAVAVASAAGAAVYTWRRFAAPLGEALPAAPADAPSAGPSAVAPAAPGASMLLLPAAQVLAVAVGAAAVAAVVFALAASGVASVLLPAAAAVASAASGLVGLVADAASDNPDLELAIAEIKAKPLAMIGKLAALVGPVFKQGSLLRVAANEGVKFVLNMHPAAASVRAAAFAAAVEFAYPAVGYTWLEHSPHAHDAGPPLALN